jgi:hypothetical protein
VTVEKMPPDKAWVEAMGDAAVDKTAPAPADKSPAAKPKSEPGVRLDDSLERLIVSEETRKP